MFNKEDEDLRKDLQDWLKQEEDRIREVCKERGIDPGGIGDDMYIPLQRYDLLNLMRRLSRKGSLFSNNRTELYIGGEICQRYKESDYKFEGTPGAQERLLEKFNRILEGYRENRRYTNHLDEPAERFETDGLWRSLLKVAMDKTPHYRRHRWEPKANRVLWLTQESPFDHSFRNPVRIAFELFPCGYLENKTYFFPKYMRRKSEVEESIEYPEALRRWLANEWGSPYQEALAMATIPKNEDCGWLVDNLGKQLLTGKFNYILLGYSEYFLPEEDIEAGKLTPSAVKFIELVKALKAKGKEVYFSIYDNAKQALSADKTPGKEIAEVLNS